MSTDQQKQIVLAALSAAGENASFSPVQIQKFFFIIDREIGNLLGGPKFNFAPYDYGPFDKAVYETLTDLSILGLVYIGTTKKYNSYSLTADGFTAGRQLLSPLPDNIKQFISNTAEWIIPLTFPELVAAIYKKYPDMKENSIF